MMCMAHEFWRKLYSKHRERSENIENEREEREAQKWTYDCKPVSYQELCPLA